MSETVTTIDSDEHKTLIADFETLKRWAPDTTFEQYIAGRIAPDGMRWRCGACGKTARDNHGDGGGWDESCMLNSFLEAA